MAALRRITADELHDRRWELLAVTSVGAFMAPLDGSIVAVALAKMGPDLTLSFGASIWVQAAYLLATAVLLIPLGRLADHRGRVRLYLAGVLVFTVGSLLSGLSMDGVWLIASRVVQGSGGALMAATSAAIVTAVFPPHERGKALGINVMAVYVGLAVGPVLGGQIVDNFGWRWIFFINIPIGLATFVWGSLLLPAREGERQDQYRADFVGATSLGAFLICLLVPLTFATEWGWTAARTVALLIVAAASLVAFVVTEVRVSDPMLDLELLRRNRLFATANLAALLNYLALYGISILTAIFLEIVQGRSAGLTGWLMVAQPAMMALLSPLAGRLSDRLGSRLLSTTGMVLVAGGMVLLGTMPTTAGIARIILSLAVVGLGMATFSAPNTSAVMGSVERSKLSLASGFLGTMRVTGQALSVAVLGAIAASKLGVSGSRLIYTGGAVIASHSARHTGSAAASVATHIAHNYALGYHYAMFTGAGLALLGALASLTRPAQVSHAQRPALRGAAQAGADR
jgi:EmrB/QacA subfamily drug resistance transporter